MTDLQLYIYLIGFIFFFIGVYCYYQKRKEGISENGYRLIVNCGSHARQEVYHLHMHLVGGNDIGPMIC